MLRYLKLLFARYTRGLASTATFSSSSAAASSCSSLPESPQSSPRDHPSLYVSMLPVSKLLQLPLKKTPRTNTLAASASNSTRLMVYGDLILSNSDNSSSSSGGKSISSSNSNSYNYISSVQPRSFKSQYSSNSLSAIFFLLLF